ncbi:hypothetical protein AAIB33_07200 [Microbacterium sp. AZCO]|uniref:hypothetical protein n=1 Tax=Microbacterium sp. AZCO TaxID=3142976 RepID=UPI0031F38F15
MPFRTITTLQLWVDEFAQRNHAVVSRIRVIPQDGSDGADTGLVGVRIPDSPTEIYIEPPTGGVGSEWSITFEPREEPVRLGARAVRKIAGEVAFLAELCDFLQTKSDAFLAEYYGDDRAMNAPPDR